jgi:hypothetical protein
MDRRVRAISAKVFRVVLAVAALCAAGSVLLTVAIEVPQWEHKIRDFKDPKDQISAQNEILKTLMQLAGGGVVLTGLYFTARTLYVSQQGQITDRFNNAIEHLGSTIPAVRLGGIYALARIAADSERDAATIVDLRFVSARHDVCDERNVCTTGRVHG